MDLRKLQSDPAAFRAALRIDADGSAVRFADVCESWQSRDFVALDPSWRGVVGQTLTGRDALHPKRAWIERPRGHSKTTDLAMSCLWALFACKRPLRGCVCAADRDQASILRDQMDVLCRSNSWLHGLISSRRDRIVNEHTGSELAVLASDVASSYGLLPDFIALDEVTHWRSRDLFDSLISSAAKRKNCVVVSICNAGTQDHWSWKGREQIRTDANWYFSSLDLPQAGWISEERIAEQRRLLPRSVFERLWLNRWQSGSGDALEEIDLEAALTLSQPMALEPGWASVVGLDLGLKRDASALVELLCHVGSYSEKAKPRRLTSIQRAMIDLELLDEDDEEYEIQHEPASGQLRLGRVRLWRPQERAVDLDEIEQTVLSWAPSLAVLDVWQAEQMTQRLAKANVATLPVNFTSKSLVEMANTVLGAFKDRAITLWDEENILRDLRAMKLVDRGPTYRLAWERNEHGHGDAGTALALAMFGSRRVEHGDANVIQGDLIIG